MAKHESGTIEVICVWDQRSRLMTMITPSDNPTLVEDGHVDLGGNYLIRGTAQKLTANTPYIFSPVSNETLHEVMAMMALNKKANDKVEVVLDARKKPGKKAA